MMTETKQSEKTFKLYGMPWQVFAIFSAVVLVAVYLEKLPKGMIGAFPIMIVIGTILNEIGERVPILNSYLGGGAIAIIFGTAALNYFSVIPEATVGIIDSFFDAGGFLNFYIAALITGSILGMNRNLLVKAAIRYFPAILGGVACSLGLVWIVGTVTGYGGMPAVLYVGIPIMGGGMGAGAVPLSQIFGDSLQVDSGYILSMMIPAVALGNAMSVVAGGLLNRFGKGKPKLSGEGQLMVLSSNEAQATQITEEVQTKRDTIGLEKMGVGLMIACSFYAFGMIINKFIPDIHGYAWMILTVAIVKIAGLLPEDFEICCYQWFQFIMKNTTGVLLVGIGISYTDLGQIIAAFTPTYLLLCFVVVLGAIIGAGAVGKLVGFFPIESSITAGLCMANMGGTGDVAVLSAANRMELMPFAQISSRLGGAFMLILASFMLNILK